MTSHREAPFSFYCTICFEPFDPDVNYPVVLPCGHTYLCHPCASRLKRCMECRTSLFTEQKVTSEASSNFSEIAASASNASVDTHMTKQADWLTHVQPVYQRQPMSMRTSQRYISNSAGRSTGPNSVTQTVSVKQVPVPLPKNFVLLDVMDASTKFQLRHSVKSAILDSKDENDKGVSDEEYDSDDDRSYVYCGIEVMNGTCGTYAVITDDATVLKELPQDDTSVNGNASSEKWKEVASSLQNDKNQKRDIFSLDELMKTLDVQVDDESVNIVSSSIIDLPMRSSNQREIVGANTNVTVLKHSDLIQVVTINGGFAKLARNQGYVRVEYSNIVKVGAPRDVACRLESMLLSLTNKASTVNVKKTNITKQIRLLRKCLAKAMINDFSFPERASEQEMARLSSNNLQISLSKSQSHEVTENDGYISPTGSNISTPIGATTPMQNVSSELMSNQRQPSPSILRTSSSHRSTDYPPQHVAFSDNNVTYTPSSDGSTAAPLFGLSPETSNNLAMPRLTQVQTTSQEHLEEFANSSPFICADMFGLVGDENDIAIHTDLVNNNPLFAHVNNNIEAPVLSPRSRSRDVNFRTGMSGHQGFLSGKAHRSSTHSRYSNRTMSSHSGLLQSRRQNRSRDDTIDTLSAPNLQNTKTW